MTTLERRRLILKAAAAAKMIGRRMPTELEIRRAFNVSGETANKDVRTLVAAGLLRLHRPIKNRHATVLHVSELRASE